MVRALLNLFRKPPAAEAVLKASSPAEGQPTGGLLVIETILQAEVETDATLKAFVGDQTKPALEKPVRLSPTAQTPWIALHGHLLPNGPAKVRLELVGRGGAVLAERTLTLKVRNEGELARQVAESLRASGVPLVVDGACDSRMYDYGDPTLTAWFDREPAAVETHLAELAASGKATPDEIEALRHFVENGYLVVEDLIAPDHLKRLNAALDDAVEKKVEGYEWGSSQRLHNLHLQYPAIRELWLHPKVMRLLGLIFGEPARPCQSLTYVFGSQQEHHQDTVHLTPFPAGRMCGVWTALEDVQPDSGELIVFPKSHKLPRVYMSSVGLSKVGEDWGPFQQKVVSYWTDLIVQNRLGREVYRPKAGTVLIWHENLMHAGSPRKDLSKSRRSIVGHYFAQGSVVYYDSSGLPGVLYEGPLA
ncbi:phytanoyl-CoA dioxygenase family protein [Phenylobacterium sp.]|uniref:phytanoyl-CoA dioxygenase family protein n=1 Tax=Phenylobacterium sp. TaxID=1871053 RepID=UPI00391D1113